MIREGMGNVVMVVRRGMEIGGNGRIVIGKDFCGREL